MSSDELLRNVSRITCWIAIRFIHWFDRRGHGISEEDISQTPIQIVEMNL